MSAFAVGPGTRLGWVPGPPVGKYRVHEVKILITLPLQPQTPCIMVSVVITLAIAAIVVVLLAVLKRSSPTTPAIGRSDKTDYKPAEENRPTVEERPTTQRKKAVITWGNFDVVGFNHLPEDTKRIVRTQIHPSDKLTLRAEPYNVHDSKAVRVLYNGTPIGWVPRDFYRKQELFDAIQAGRDVRVNCQSKSRTYISAYFEMDK